MMVTTRNGAIRCWLAATVLSITFGAGVVAAESAAPPVDSTQVAQWAKARAIPLSGLELSRLQDDLRFLDGIVGNVRVVGLGEALHGAHEMLALRNRVFRYLVEHHAFTAIAAETDFAMGTAIDDYVNGLRPLSPQIAAAVFSFSAPDVMQENLQLIQWMHDYNVRIKNGRKLHFYGLEMLGHSLGTDRPTIDVAMNAALEFMGKVDVESARRFREKVTPTYAAMTARSYERGDRSKTPYGELSQEQRDMLTIAIADMVALFERRHVDWTERTSVLEYQRALRNAMNARALDADFRADGWWLGGKDMDQRDAMSAQNLQWALRQEGRQGRVLLFAHDVHISTVKGTCKRHFASLGQNLRHDLAGDMVTVAAVAPPDPKEAGDRACSLADVMAEPLSKLGLPLFGLDLRGHPLHDGGGFDALIYVQSNTPARVLSTEEQERLAK